MGLRSPTFDESGGRGLEDVLKVEENVFEGLAPTVAAPVVAVPGQGLEVKVELFFFERSGPLPLFLTINLANKHFMYPSLFKAKHCYATFKDRLLFWLMW
jgi:hypothetical protein